MIAKECCSSCRTFKEILWGLVLLLCGLALCAPAMFMNNGLALLALMAGILISAAGIYRAYHGSTHHEVVEKRMKRNRLCH